MVAADSSVRRCCVVVEKKERGDETPCVLRRLQGGKTAVGSHGQSTRPGCIPAARLARGNKKLAGASFLAGKLTRTWDHVARRDWERQNGVRTEAARGRKHHRAAQAASEQQRRGGAVGESGSGMAAPASRSQALIDKELLYGARSS